MRPSLYKHLQLISVYIKTDILLLNTLYYMYKTHCEGSEIVPSELAANQGSKETTNTPHSSTTTCTVLICKEAWVSNFYK